jgi:hypothetical protein
MTAVGDEIRIPSKTDQKGWSSMAELILMPLKSDRKLSRRKVLTLRLHYLNSLGLTDERLNEMREIQEELSRFPKSERDRE